MFDRVEEAAARVQVLCGRLPETAIVLGSGLGDFADTLQNAVAFPYAELPHWPAFDATHRPRMVFANTSRVGNDPIRAQRIAMFEALGLAS